MKISIITVVWNNKSTIEDAITSILSQTYPDIEYIIIDGNSTDGTLDVIKKYENSISHFVSEPDKGIYDAMNKGIRCATGEVVGILNSDDVYADENIIQKVMNTFIQKNVDSVYGDLFYVKQDDLMTPTRYWKSTEFKKGSFTKGWHPPHPSFFVKRKIYETHGSFDLNMKVSADFELMLRFLEKHNISTAYLPETIVKMRVGGESNSSLKNIIKGNQNVLKAFDKNGIKVNKILYPVYRLAPKVIQLIKKGK